MQRILLLVLISYMALTTEARADDVEGPPAAPKSVEMNLDGEPGVWIPLAMSKKIQLDVELGLVMKEKIALQGTLLAIRSERITACQEAKAEAVKSEQAAFDGLEDAYKEAEAAKKELGVWYRHPALWVAVGIVLTVGLEIGTYQLVTAAAN